MLNTRAIRVSATLFHKHKYISNQNVTPADAFIAAAENLALALKGTIPACLQQSPLEELMRLSEVLSEEAASPSFSLTTPYPRADMTHKPFSQQISSKVNKNGHMELSARPPTRETDKPPTKFSPLPVFYPRVVQPNLKAPRVEPPI